MTKQTRWAWAIATVVLTGILLVCTFVLTLTSENSLLSARQLKVLFWLNVAVAGILTVVIAFAMVRLVIRAKKGKFGTVLLIKLAGIFALVGVLPGLLIYFVSYQFVSRSIETWFDEQVQIALDAGLELGKRTLEDFIANSGEKTVEIAERMAQAQSESDSLVLLTERLRDQTNAHYLGVISHEGNVVFEAIKEQNAQWKKQHTMSPSQLAAWIKQANTQRFVTQLEGLDSSHIHHTTARTLSIARIPDTQVKLNSQPKYVLLVRELPADLAEHALTVQVAYTQYQQRALARDGLRQTYIGTLTLALILVLLGAVFLAALLGHQLARPLLMLARGMQQVAAGDLSAKPVIGTRDELGGLTRNFADMTEQLEQARRQAENSLMMLEASRTRLQTILDSLSTGVIVFDAHQRIDTVNPGAMRILKLPLNSYQRGQHLQDTPELAVFSERIWQRFESHTSSPEAGEREYWQDTFELELPHAKTTLVLLIRGGILPINSRLVVFDDITEITSAQRSVAWAEVARRVAHEIKNPLTPIQLSAQRLQHKLHAKLDEPDQALLNRSVNTIVEQVQAMIKLVNEFRNYARMPAAQLIPLDLNELISDVMALYAQAIEQGRIQLHCERPLPLIHGDATQLRQVVHNLVQNSLDAIEDQFDGRVDIITRTVRNEQGNVRAVRLYVRDNGPGFSAEVIHRAFEPYVTTKTKGTGLGLAVVRKIAEEHHARIRIGNQQDAIEADSSNNMNKTSEKSSIGAEVSLSFPLLS